MRIFVRKCESVRRRVMDIGTVAQHMVAIIILKEVGEAIVYVNLVLVA